MPCSSSSGSSRIDPASRRSRSAASRRSQADRSPSTTSIGYPYRQHSRPLMRSSPKSAANGGTGCLTSVKSWRSARKARLGRSPSPLTHSSGQQRSKPRPPGQAGAGECLVEASNPAPVCGRVASPKVVSGAARMRICRLATSIGDRRSQTTAQLLTPR